MPNNNSLRDPADLKIQALEAQMRLMRDEISRLTSMNVDMNGRRVINAKHSRNDNDYIIKAELKKAKSDIINIIHNSVEPPEVVDLKKYFLDFTTKRLNYGSFTLDDITISLGASLVNVANIDIDGIYVVAAAIDEVTLEDYQEELLAINLPNLDVSNVVFTTSNPSSWRVGDYILINNTYAMLGVAYAFEIFKVVSVTGPVVELVRDGSNPGVLTSWFNTPKSFHIGSFKAYRVQVLNFPFEFKSGIFYNPTSRTGFAERLDIIAPNMCIVGVSAVLYNKDGLGNWVRKCLSSSPIVRQQWESEDPTEISPGLRTLNGAAYYFSTTGVLGIGLESDFYIRPADTSPIRCIFGYLEVAPDSDLPDEIVCTVDFIEVDEGSLVETVIETIEVYDGEIVSGDPLYPPEARQLPYNPKSNLIGDTAGLKWPVPLLRKDKRYKTQVKTIGSVAPGTTLIVVVGT